MGVIENLVYLRTRKLLYPIVNTILLLLSVEIPRCVSIGKQLRLQHMARGLVVHPLTRIGNNVEIYHGVTLGAAKPWDGGLKLKRGYNYCIDIQDDVVLCAGCKVLCKDEIVVRRGTIVGANAVLICSTGENEIWAGIRGR